MKKRKFLFLPLVALVLLSACGKTEAKTNENSETTESSSAVEKVETVFYEGELSEDATEEEADVVKVALTQVTGASDPQSLLNSMEDGVVLHVPKELLEGIDLSALTSGSKVSFALKEPAIMTMSLPPQVPGNSIEALKLAE